MGSSADVPGDLLGDPQHKQKAVWTGLWLRGATAEMLEGRPVPTSEGRKDGHRGTKKPCVFHQPLRACDAAAQEWSMILPSKDSAIKDWGNDVFNVFCLMRLSRQGLTLFFFFYSFHEND